MDSSSINDIHFVKNHYSLGDQFSCLTCTKDFNKDVIETYENVWTGYSNNSKNIILVKIPGYEFYCKVFKQDDIFYYLDPREQVYGRPAKKPININLCTKINIIFKEHSFKEYRLTENNNRVDHLSRQIETLKREVEMIKTCMNKNSNGSIVIKQGDLTGISFLDSTSTNVPTKSPQQKRNSNLNSGVNQQFLNFNSSLENQQIPTNLFELYQQKKNIGNLSNNSEGGQASSSSNFKTPLCNNDDISMYFHPTQNVEKGN